MDTTECFGFSFPQCDPPLTKDASDIEQFRDLAVAVDDAVGEYAQQIDDQVVSPDAARLTNAAVFTSTLADNVIAVTSTVFDNTPGDAMSDLVNGGIRIVTSGWYLVGAWVVSTVATDVLTRGRILVNADPATNFHGPGAVATAGRQDITITNTLQLIDGDLLQVSTRNNSPGTSVDYTVFLWAVLVAPNV